MTNKEFKTVARLLKQAYLELEKEAISQGFDIMSKEYDELVSKTREKILENSGFTLEEYRSAKEANATFTQDAVNKNLSIMEDTTKTLEYLKEVHIPTRDEITKIAHDVAKEYIKPPQITNQIVKEITKEVKIEQPKIIETTKVINKVEKYNAKPLEEKIKKLETKIGDIKIPEPIDIEAIKSDLKLDFNKELKHNIDILGMPDFRKLAMGLQSQIDNLGSGTPAGSNTQIQYNNNGVFGASPNLTFNGLLETITADSLGSNTSDTKGLALINTTSATSLLNQVSPAIKFKGNGWKTNATAGSQLVEGRIYLNVLTGTANPQGAMRIQTALNGDSFANHVFDVWSDGIVSIEEGGPFPSGYAKLQIPSINITSGGSIRLAENKGSSGQFLGSDGTKTIWATPTVSLTNGSATTANGSAVDLGGTQGANVTITNGSTYFFKIESSSNKAFFLLDPTNKIYQLGDIQSDTNGNFLTVDDNSNKSYFDRDRTHDGRLGIMTDSPLSTNDTLGSQGLAYRKITADNDTATEADYTCSVDNGGSNWAFNLPDPTGCLRRIYVVKRYDNNSTGTVQVTTSGGKLQNPEDGSLGSTTYNLQAWGASNPFYSVMWQSNGTDWEAIK